MQPHGKPCGNGKGSAADADRNQDCDDLFDELGTHEKDAHNGKRLDAEAEEATPLAVWLGMAAEWLAMGLGWL